MITFRLTTIGGHLLTGDQTNAKTSTWKYTILLRDIIHAPAGIRTRNSNKRTAKDPRLKPRGRCERVSNNWDILEKSLSCPVLWIYFERTKRTKKNCSEYLVSSFRFETQTFRTRGKTVPHFIEEWFLNSNNLYIFDRDNYCRSRCKVSGKRPSLILLKVIPEYWCGVLKKMRKNLSGKLFLCSRRVHNYGTEKCRNYLAEKFVYEQR